MCIPAKNCALCDLTPCYSIFQLLQLLLDREGRFRVGFDHRDPRNTGKKKPPRLRINSKFNTLRVIAVFRGVTAVLSTF